MFLQRAMRYYRLLIYTCNLVLFVSVVLFFIFLCTVLSDSRMSLVPGVKLYHPTIVYGILALILQGGFIQILGCFAAFRLNERLIHVYWCLMLFLVAGDVITGVVWIFRYDTIMSDFKPSIRSKLVTLYGTDESFTSLLDQIQADNQCCGVYGTHDYNLSNWKQSIQEARDVVPDSCCKPDASTTTTSSLVSDEEYDTRTADGFLYTSRFLNRKSDFPSDISSSFITQSQRSDRLRRDMSPRYQSKMPLLYQSNISPKYESDIPRRYSSDVSRIFDSDFSSRYRSDPMETTSILLQRLERTVAQSRTHSFKAPAIVTPSPAPPLALEQTLDSSSSNIFSSPPSPGRPYTDGCGEKLQDWLSDSFEILLVLGYCVIAFLKICFVGILRYEIKEMIQKIKILNGEQEQMLPELSNLEIPADIPEREQAPVPAPKEIVSAPDSYQNTPLHLMRSNDPGDSDTNSHSALITERETPVKRPNGNNNNELHELKEMRRTVRQTQI